MLRLCSVNIWVYKDAAEALSEFLLQGLRLPMAVARGVEAIAHEHAGIEDILNLAALFFSEYLETWHACPR